MQFENVQDEQNYLAFIKLFPQYQHTISFCTNKSEKRAYVARRKSKRREWVLQQATPRGCQSAVNSRYKAIHKRGLTVDHIVPLYGCNEAGDHVVCGLNVAWNLRGETEKNNVKKGNLFVDNKDSLAIIVSVVNKQLREKTF